MNWTEYVLVANLVLLVVILKGLFIIAEAIDRVETIVRSRP